MPVDAICFASSFLCTLNLVEEPLFENDQDAVLYHHAVVALDTSEGTR